MNLMAWMNEVRRLRRGIDTRSPEHVDRETVALEHCPDKSCPAKGEIVKMVWRAKHGSLSVDATTPEAAMRGLLELLEARIAEQIAKKRSELAELERVQSSGLRLVAPGKDLPS
jgi:hypothetical protein